MNESTTIQSEGVFYFWIIERHSGITIFSQQFQEVIADIDSDLMGGFLIAMLSFAKEIANQSIQHIQLTNYRLLYNISGNFAMVVLTHNSMEPSRTNALLELIQKKFEERYGQLLKDKCVIDVQIFKDFVKVTEKIFNAETQYLRIVKDRASKLEEYFNQASLDWIEFHKKIKLQQSLRETWIHENIITINKKIQRDLQDVRGNLKKWYDEQKNRPSQYAGIWVKSTE